MRCWGSTRDRVLHNPGDAAETSLEKRSDRHKISGRRMRKMGAAVGSSSSHAEKVRRINRCVTDSVGAERVHG